MEKESATDTTFFRFEDLRIYHKSLDYIDWVMNTTRQTNNGGDMNGILDKFNASAQSIAYHIAEGSARNKSQFIYYLKMAKSAVRECVVITSLLEKQNIINESEVEASRNELMEMTKMIGALIGSLQKTQHHKKGNKGNGKGSEELILEEDPTNFNKY
jgi:four helix bundle protein